MPRNSRAYAVSVLAMASGLGAGVAVMALPLADISASSWRLVYLVSLVWLVVAVDIARRLPETRRFERPHVIAPPLDRRRFAVLASVALLANLFVAPASLFQNGYLKDVRGFSATTIAIFTIGTATPAGIGLILGGRIADVSGRKRLIAVGLPLATALIVLSYSVGGPVMWLSVFLAGMLGGAHLPGARRLPHRAVPDRQPRPGRRADHGGGPARRHRRAARDGDAARPGLVARRGDGAARQRPGRSSWSSSCAGTPRPPTESSRTSTPMDAVLIRVLDAVGVVGRCRRPHVRQHSGGLPRWTAPAGIVCAAPCGLLGCAATPPRPEPGDNVDLSLLGAEGGWQDFVLKGGEWTVLLLSVAAALLAIGVGFYLVRVGAGRRRGHAEDARDRPGHPGGRLGLPASASSARSP